MNTDTHQFQQLPQTDVKCRFFAQYFGQIFLRTFYNNTTKPKKQVMIKENCLYIPALNYKNAIRHIHNKISKEFNLKIIE